MKSTCRETGKVKHESEGRALSAAVNRVGKNTAYLRAYKCPYCFKWHLTSKKR